MGGKLGGFGGPSRYGGILGGNEGPLKWGGGSLETMFNTICHSKLLYELQSPELWNPWKLLRSD